MEPHRRYIMILVHLSGCVNILKKMMYMNRLYIFLLQEWDRLKKDLLKEYTIREDLFIKTLMVMKIGEESGII